MTSARPVIVWLRKDLRLDDNAALAAAAETGAPIIPLYIYEPESAGTGPLGGAQKWWLHHSLAAFGESLRPLGSRLVLKSGGARTVLEELIRETSAGAVFWNRRYDPLGIAVDTPVKQALKADDIAVKSFPGQILHEPTRLLTGGGKPFRVYTPFWNALDRAGDPLPPADAPRRLHAPDGWPQSERLDDWNLLPVKPDWASGFGEIFTPGEAEAHRRLDAFLSDRLEYYDSERDFPAKDATSLLSPHLAMGEISPARIWHATKGLGGRAGHDNLVRFRKELAWRDFCYHLLYHFPDLPTRNWNNRFDAFDWHFDAARFAKWTKGLTGYPIVDAGMRQLWRHGTMHNRVRMIAASFLVKDLLIDWRHGERWFRDTLVDADPASNAANWQWVAGSGADASPWFRIFNPVLQGEKFDPKGDYVREFVPELAKLDDKYIHRPFEAPADVLSRAGIVPGEAYPQPLVDHADARRKALAAYAATGQTGPATGSD
ncbi:DNA photolyase family protein [Rhizobiaceae bacterium BDR2-2]|uniref:Deoxyribodipyrimidine photo-lyase n=1 Tax=Ectorhizobium quercum TaxID=2965071 RepID=A0AAE3SUS7_9HYPH|nr:deoxyribodipyrimidine photo-lyase [Ectorhizobium quercum]MCX8997550.1 DNA photolyase family protein [Ectorhizobium quercum]